MKKKVQLLPLIVLTVLCLFLSACSGQSEPAATAGSAPASQPEAGESTPALEAGNPLRVAFLYDTPVNDGGWISSHELGRLAVEDMDGVETTYADNVSDSQGWNYINNFAKEGYDVIFGCTFAYMQDMQDVAVNNPDSIFMHCSGYLLEENMGNYFGANYEGAYLAGMACGGMTKSNLLGYVAPYPIAEVIRNINAFALGAKAVNPDVKVQVVWISAWYDPTLASEAAETLISAGADALFHYENSPAVVQTADKHGVYSIGQHADCSKYSKYCLTSSLWNWDVLYTDIVEQVQNSTWKSEEIWVGVKDGVVDIAPLNESIPQDLQAKIMAARELLVKGDVTGNPFYGEVKDQSGTVRLPAGTDATFGELMGMDYLVENVIGEIG